MRRLSVLVTVGMGPFPFDRLVQSLETIAPDHDVFAQIGTSTVVPSVPHVRELSPEELDRRIAGADVVITHAGNTVRSVQRHGKVPIVVPRKAKFGEMSNDHQVRFAEHERTRSPVVVLDDVAELAQVVADHPTVAATVAERTVPPASATCDVRARLETVIQPPADNPFDDHPTRRYGWAWDQLAGIDGPHLDLGAGYGEFAAGLSTVRPGVVAADVASDKISDTTHGGPPRVALGNKLDLPFGEATLASVSMLDVLEHVWDEQAVLSEVRRVLQPGGTLIVTVPRQHWLSILDPDNAKFRWPRLHGAVYRARFGRERYDERFVDMSDGMAGDLAIERGWHTNYVPAELFETLAEAGFDVVQHDAANLFWRFFDIPRLLLPQRLAPLTHLPLRLDGRWFHQANLFVRAVRR